jgi:TolB-like protein
MLIRSGALLFCAVLVAACPALAPAQVQPGKPLIAVLDLDTAAATREQAIALSNQLRAELLRTGRFTVVDRSQINAMLEEQAFQQAGCTSQECAVRVGRILGVRQIVTGSVTRVDAGLWQVSAILIDVETAETLRAETLNHEGSFTDLLTKGVRQLAAMIAPAGRPASPPAAAKPASAPETGRTAWQVKWIGALALGLAAGYYGMAEAQATAKSNDRQKAILDEMAAAATNAQYSSLAKRLKSEEDEAKSHKASSDLGYVAGAALIGLAAWVYFDPPRASDPTALGMVPSLHAAPGTLRMGVALRW